MAEESSDATQAFTEVASLLGQVDLSAQQPALIGTNAPVGCAPPRPPDRATARGASPLIFLFAALRLSRLRIF